MRSATTTTWAAFTGGTSTSWTCCRATRRAPAPRCPTRRCCSGYPGKLGFDGSQVWDAYRAGELTRIRRYCETDVVNTWLVFLRFQHMRGRLTDAGLAEELARTRALAHRRQTTALRRIPRRLGLGLVNAIARGHSSKAAAAVENRSGRRSHARSRRRGAGQRGRRQDCFVAGALPGERISFRRRSFHKSHDEAELLEVHEASPARATPRCAHFGVCGGCAMQHLDPAAQIEAKQKELAQNLQRIGNVEPDEWLPPLLGPHWNYRRRARLSSRFVAKKGRSLVGFREKQGKYVADVQRCEVLAEPVGIAGRRAG